MRRNFDLLIAFLLLNISKTTAFAPSSRTNNQSRNKKILSFSRLSDLEQKTPDDIEVERLLATYSEKSRFRRRKFFSSADWVKSRRSDRFMTSIKTTFQSGLIRQIQPELSAIIAVSVLVVLYNDVLAVGYMDFEGIQHPGLAPFLPPLELPIIAWSLSSSALGLLLAFRTNVCYARWNEARTAWGKIINDSRSIARMGCIWSKSYKGISDESLQRLGDAICSFSRSLMNRTLPPQEDEANFVIYTYKKIKDKNYGKVLRNAKHRPTAALAEITSILVDFQLNPLHQVEVEMVVTGLCDALGTSERLFTSPVPRLYSRHTSRFLAFWLLTLPTGLYEPLKDSWNHWAVLPMTLIIAAMFLGIDELANQMEEPFSILPMEKMCEGSIRTAVMEQVDRSQLGKQAAYCGEDSHLIDANPDKIRTIPENPRWLQAASPINRDSQHFRVDDGDSQQNKVNGINGADPNRIAPEMSHWMGAVNDGESSHQMVPKEEAQADTPTFADYMKSRNLENLDAQ